MSTPAWINAVCEECTIPEIIEYIVGLHRDLHNLHIDSRPPDYAITSRNAYCEELIRLWSILQTAQSRFDVV